MVVFVQELSQVMLRRNLGRRRCVTACMTQSFVYTNTDQDFGSKETNQNPAEVGTLISRLLVKYTYYTGRIDLAS